MKARAMDAPVRDIHQFVMTNHGPTIDAVPKTKSFIGPMVRFKPLFPTGTAPSSTNSISPMQHRMEVFQLLIASADVLQIEY
jgi:hypothetical protein